MDYGSIVCTPRNPNCTICLIKKNCFSFQKNIQNSIPTKTKSNTIKRKKFSRAYICLNENNEILLRKRNSKGMLASMLEVPNDKWVENKKSLMFDDIILNFKKKLKLKGNLKYSFSHFDLETDVFFIKVRKNMFENYKWINKNKVKGSGLPTVMKQIIESAF